MTYQVVLQRLAIQDLQEYYEYAAQHSRSDAASWLDRFQAALVTLNKRPERCSLASENDKVEVELREFLFGKRPNVYRAILMIDKDVVRVLRIRRSRRRFLSVDELKQAIDDDTGMD